jgi:hypothetical protein
MTLDDSARRLAEAVAAEQELFEVVGGWVTQTPEPEPKLLFARQSRRHGEHALRLLALLPDTRDHDPRSLVAAAAVGTGLRGLEAAGRVAGLASALQAQRDRLGAYLAAASPVRDGPGVRVASEVLAATSADLEELQGLAGR